MDFRKLSVIAVVLFLIVVAIPAPFAGRPGDDSTGSEGWTVAMKNCLKSAPSSSFARGGASIGERVGSIFGKWGKKWMGEVGWLIGTVLGASKCLVDPLLNYLSKLVWEQILGWVGWAFEALIEHMIERLKMATLPNEIILCTSINSQDDILVDVAEKTGIKYFRGSELDESHVADDCALPVHTGHRGGSLPALLFNRPGPEGPREEHAD